MMWKFIKVAVVAFLAAMSPAAVVGHGYMNKPAARNVQRGPQGDKQSLNCGGRAAQWDNDRLRYSTGNPFGLCDRCGSDITESKPRSFEEGGKYATPPIIAANYAPGSAVDIEIVITANHGGRFSFRLCAPPGNPSDQACYDTMLLKQSNGDPYFYIHSGGADTYHMQYMLPQGVTCDRCVLQWLYTSANSCNIPGMPAAFVVGQNMGDCGSNTAVSPESFINCADIRIGAGGQKLVAQPVSNGSSAAGTSVAQGSSGGDSWAGSGIVGGDGSGSGGGGLGLSTNEWWAVGGVASCSCTALIVIIILVIIMNSNSKKY